MYYCQQSYFLASSILYELLDVVNKFINTTGHTC